MKNKIKKWMKKAKAVVMTIWLQMMVPTIVLATETEPVLVSGTRKLLAAGTAILTTFIIGVLVFNAYKVGMKWMNAAPEEKPKYQKEFITLIGIGVVVLTAGSTITWIVGFYGFTA